MKRISVLVARKLVTTDGASDDSSSFAQTRPNMWTKWQTKLPFRGDRSPQKPCSPWIQFKNRKRHSKWLWRKVTESECSYFELKFQFKVESDLPPVLQRWIDRLSSWILCFFITLSQCKIPWLYKWVK